jgi:pimeloyl-ACP methyl ester carboxylesterase
VHEDVWLFERELRKTMKLEMNSKYPVGKRRPTPLLFIHGALHGAWCWDGRFLDYFAQHDYAAYAVNLRGQGNSEGLEKLRWTRIADYVEDVANAARQLPGFCQQPSRTPIGIHSSSPSLT